MELLTRTLWNSYLQTCEHLRRPFELTPFTTLNEKFDVLAGIAPGPTQMPSVGYLAIGNGGHMVATGAQGMPKVETLQHKASDAALFNHLPFVLREPTDDLDPVLRAKYALRTEKTYNGVRYIAYYLRRIDLSNVRPTIKELVIDGDTEVVKQYVPTSANLSPTPQYFDTSGVNVVDGHYVSAGAVIDLSMSEFDMKELANVANIIYQDEELAVVSEMAICSGIDYVIQVTTPGVGTFNFNDAIAVQVMAFINTFYSGQWANKGFEYFSEVGATEPLFKLNKN